MIRIFLFCLLMIPAGSHCQEIVFLSDCEKMMFGSYNVTYRNTVDTSHLTVRYDCLFGDDAIPKECAILQIGREHTRFYGQNQWNADSVYTVAYNDPSYHCDPAKVAATPEKRCLSFEVIRNRRQREVGTYHRIPFRHDWIVVFFEEEVNAQCNLTQRVRMIGDYQCFHARIAVGGRIWDAWFAPEIPIDAGPWKLCGLPGLILEAADTTGSYRFVFRSLRNCKEIITIPQQKITVTDKKRWLRYEKRIHENPRSLLPQATVYSCDADNGDIIELDASWTIPYNPLELE